MTESSILQLLRTQKIQKYIHNSHDYIPVSILTKVPSPKLKTIPNENKTI